MTPKIEHANVTVRDVETVATFLKTAFPEFRVRREGTNDGRRWMHIGTDATYIALSEASGESAERWVPYSGKPGVNHLGYEVEDADAIRRRLATAGYQDSTYPNRHPHRKRVYFHDPEGNDWEFVEYLSDVPAERNDYDLPD